VDESIEKEMRLLIIWANYKKVQLEREERRRDERGREIEEGKECEVEII
jgi:hypothetical protein